MSLHKLVSILLRKTFSQIASRKRQVSRDYFRLFIWDGKSRGHLNLLFFLSEQARNRIRIHFARIRQQLSWSVLSGSVSMLSGSVSMLSGSVNKCPDKVISATQFKESLCHKIYITVLLSIGRKLIDKINLVRIGFFNIRLRRPCSMKRLEIADFTWTCTAACIL